MKLVVANGSAIRIEGDAKLKFIREGNKCCMEYLDADVDGESSVMFGQQ